MNKQRKFILIAAAVGALAVFLPWLSVSVSAFGYSGGGGSVNGFHGAGIFYFLLMAGAGVVAYATGNRAQTLDKNMRMATLACGAVGAICVFLYFQNKPDGYSSGFGSVDVNPGMGAILAFLAAAAVVAVPLVIKNAGESLSADLANMRQGARDLTAGMNSNTTPSGNTPVNNSSTNSKMDELQRIGEMRDKGLLTEEEFTQMKARILQP